MPDETKVLGTGPVTRCELTGIVKLMDEMELLGVAVENSTRVGGVTWGEERVMVPACVVN